MFAFRIDAARLEPFRRRWRTAAYTLSLTVYCTSWTFYGAVGSASIGGWSYLPIYLGPILLFAFGIRWLRRLMAAAAHEQATSVSDFIGARFGRDRGVAALVTLLALAGTVPYLALQLRSVGTTYAVLAGHGRAVWPMAVTAGLLAIFAMLFGTRRYEAAGRHDGVLFAIALESTVKLIAFLAVGIFSAVLIVGLPQSARLVAGARFAGLFAIGPATPDFVVMTLLAAAAAICLPRQFHMAVVQAADVRDIDRARWPFVFYLMLVSALVLPITLAGIASGSPHGMAADLRVLTMPMAAGEHALALLVFIGGFSAATGMVVVETIALSTMISNDLVAPLLFRRMASTSEADVGVAMLRLRRLVIVLLLAVALGYATAMPARGTLAGTGLVAFAATAQFAPALVMAVVGAGRDAVAAKAGLGTGLIFWAALVLVPALEGWSPIGWLAIAGFGPLAEGAVISLGANLSVHALVAARRVRASRIAMLPRFREAADRVTTTDELVGFVARFVGMDKAAMLADGAGGPVDRAHARAAERLIAGVVGAPSARALMASALSGASLSARDVVRMFDEGGQSLQFSQGLLAATLENIDPAVSVVDHNLDMVAWNSRYLEMFAFPPGMIRVGAPVADAIAFNAARGECGPGEIADHVERRLAHMRRAQRHSFERIRDDGRVLKTIGGPMPGGGYVMCFSDVTAEAQARLALEAARLELETRVVQRTAELSSANIALSRATADKTRFLAAASHDLVQPLHAARLFAGALDRELGGHPLVAKVDQSIVSAERLLRALLDISRLDAGGMEPVIAPVALRPLLRELVDGFALQAAEKGLSLRLARGDATVASDRTMVRSILQNFLSNAVRYTARGGVVIGIRRRGGAVMVAVWDTGPGIPRADQGRIFGEFERLESGDEAGVGLGLAIVERTARLLRAPLSLTSEPGRGSCFAITLPLSIGADVAPVRETEGAVLPPRSATILVVDDEPRVREAMTALLTARGHRVIAARGAMSALAVDAHYDIALVDLHLDEDMDGLAVIAALSRRVPGLLVTADPDPAVLLRAAAQGVPMLAKPLDPQALDRWLSEALRA